MTAQTAVGAGWAGSSAHEPPTPRSSDVVGSLASVSLEEIQELADLQTRVDRKYVVPAALVSELVAEQDGLRVLEIDGRRSFGYESVYFDTPQLLSYRGAAHSRRRRFKVRTRTYSDTGQCVFEVKVKGGRGETVKERLPYGLVDAAALTADARSFAVEVLSGALPDAEAVVPDLSPTLATTYTRTTFVDPTAGTRMTCDADLVCSGLGDHDQGAGGQAGLGDQVVVESKSPGAATAVDRWLWARGHRPVSLSKYCVGLAALDAALPSNKWNQALRRHFS